MKELNFKKVIIIAILLIMGYILIDAILHWDEAVAAFHKGYNDMNAINESRSKEHLK